jgi:hypothetical protein
MIANTIVSQAVILRLPKTYAPNATGIHRGANIIVNKNVRHWVNLVVNSNARSGGKAGTPARKIRWLHIMPPIAIPMQAVPSKRVALEN